MSSHVGRVVNGNGAKQGRLIMTWTLGEFRQAVWDAGYLGFQSVYWQNQPSCQFPECPTRTVYIDRSFTEDEGIRLWEVRRAGEQPRIIPCCAWHDWNGIKGSHDVSIEPIMRREHDMMSVFAAAMGFYLVTKPPDKIPFVSHVAVV